MFSVYDFVILVFNFLFVCEVNVSAFFTTNNNIVLKCISISFHLFSIFFNLSLFLFIIQLLELLGSIDSE